MIQNENTYKMYVVYLIQNGNKTYVGMSNDPIRRLRQHNQEIRGGAKYTCAAGPGWRHVLFVEGFDDKISAMQFEYAVKHEPPIKAHGVANRIQKIIRVLKKLQWTSNARPSSEFNLKFVLFQDVDLDLLDLPENVVFEKACP